MMEWTSDKPTKEGWYWLRGVEKRVVMIVQIMLVGQGNRERLYVVYEGEMEGLDSFSGEWSSEPITEPSSVKG